MKLKINTNTANMSNASILVYGGKNGFRTTFGSTTALCSSFEYNPTRIILHIENLHYIYDDFFAAPSNMSNVFVKIPITQYAKGSGQFGSIGFLDTSSSIDLEILRSNVYQNTITVLNSQNIDGILAHTFLNSPPFKFELFQPSATNKYYIQGNFKPLKTIYNVEGMTGFSSFPLKCYPQSKDEITVLIDDVVIEDFVWPASSNTQMIEVAVPINSERLESYVSSEKPPPIEIGDKISIPGLGTSLTVTDANYVKSSPNYDLEMLKNRNYVVQLKEPVSNEYLGYQVVNISPNLEGKIVELANNFIVLDTDSEYPHKYSLANYSAYYLYNKNKIKLTQGRLDEYGRLIGVAPGNYIINATNINRYNRLSPLVSSLLSIEPLRLSKVFDIKVDETITIDTTGGATINAIISFPPIKNVDIDDYEVKYRIIEEDKPVPSVYTSRSAVQDEETDRIRLIINNLTRGRSAGSNLLDIIVTPRKGDYRGFSSIHTHSLVGKKEKPSGLSNFNVAQQGDTLLFTWVLAINFDGFLTDLDTNEIEIREYDGLIEDLTKESIEAAWGVAQPSFRKTSKDSGFIAPISKFGNYTFLARVRDTSNIESEGIAVASVSIRRPSTSKVYKAYNESNAAVSITIRDGVPFPNSNTHVEIPFPSVTQGMTSGLVLPGSTFVDNANGSSQGYSVAAGTEFLTSSVNPVSEYVTQIRDVGSVITGTIRVNPVISINTTNFTFNSQKRVIIAGVSDPHASGGVSVDSSILVDTTGPGIGSILGYNNANAALATYNVFHNTLTSGGIYGNVFAIVAGDTTTANANSFALIAGIINENAIRLGQVYDTYGNPTGSNNFGNVTMSGNSYHLVDLLQFGDPEGSITFLGPETSVLQNVYVRYATDNVFYEAAANGVSGPVGNVNPLIFTGSGSTGELAYKSFVPGQLTFRYFQIRYRSQNKLPDISEVTLNHFSYSVDVQSKTFSREVIVDNVGGVIVDYSTVEYIEPPNVTITLIDADISYSCSVYDVTTTECRVKVFNSQTGVAVDTQKVNLVAVGI